MIFKSKVYGKFCKFAKKPLSMFSKYAILIITIAAWFFIKIAFNINIIYCIIGYFFTAKMIYSFIHPLIFAPITKYITIQTVCKNKIELNMNIPKLRKNLEKKHDFYSRFIYAKNIAQEFLLALKKLNILYPKDNITYETTTWLLKPKGNNILKKYGFTINEEKMSYFQKIEILKTLQVFTTKEKSKKQFNAQQIYKIKWTKSETKNLLKSKYLFHT